MNPIFHSKLAEIRQSNYYSRENDKYRIFWYCDGSLSEGMNLEWFDATLENLRDDDGMFCHLWLSPVLPQVETECLHS